MKCLWIVGGGIEAVPSVRRAKQMGLFVVVADGNPAAPAFALADAARKLDEHLTGIVEGAQWPPRRCPGHRR